MPLEDQERAKHRAAMFARVCPDLTGVWGNFVILQSCTTEYEIHENIEVKE